jgi:MFS family permease
MRTRHVITAGSARRRLLLLTATRWLPVGLVIGLTGLLPLQRGISLAELGVLFAVQGFVVLGLELPTGGIADAVGRRPVLVAASALAVLSGVVYVLASGFWLFVLALALQGVSRALDSGPLEAWYVDAALADDQRTPVERTLSLAGTVLGGAIAAGAVASGGLVWWQPFGAGTALVLPFLIAAALNVVHLVLVALLVVEPVPSRSALFASTLQTPAVIRAGLGLLRTDRILLCLVGVEVFWSVGMIAFETFLPIRLSELLGSETAAGAVIGPIAGVAWGVFAVGSALAGLGSRTIGVAWTAIAARVLNGAFVVGMGLATGPVGLLAAYLVAYGLHGVANPVHAALLHRQASRGNRATVLSINSMVAQGCHSVGVLLLFPLAAATSTAMAIAVAGAFSVLGAALYWPALRCEQRGRAVEMRMVDHA